MDRETSSAIDAATFEAIMREGVPLIGAYGIVVRSIAAGRVVLAMPAREEFVRPGGTITGPALFGLADVALYGAVLSRIGRVELAVTTSMTINFLRRPAMKGLVAEARLIRLGRRLAYGEVMLYSEGEPEPVAHATGSYSIPSLASVETSATAAV